MSDETRVELPLPDDYNDLKALAAEHGIEHQGVKKAVLQAELCKVAERQAIEAAGDDEHETVPGSQEGGPLDEGDGAPVGDASADGCEDCPDPTACLDAGACSQPADEPEADSAGDEPGLDLETVAELPDDRAPITRTRPDGTWWCPFCDHSNGTDRGDACEKCRGCGAVRDGDEAVAC